MYHDLTVTEKNLYLLIKTSMKWMIGAERGDKPIYHKEPEDYIHFREQELEEHVRSFIKMFSMERKSL